MQITLNSTISTSPTAIYLTNSSTKIQNNLSGVSALTNNKTKRFPPPVPWSGLCGGPPVDGSTCDQSVLSSCSPLPPTNSTICHMDGNWTIKSLSL